MFRGEGFARDGVMIDRNDEIVPLVEGKLPEERAESAELSADGIELSADEWSQDDADIEEAYQKALAAMDDIPLDPDATETVSEGVTAGTGNPAIAPGEATTPLAPQSIGPRLASGTERQSHADTEPHSQVTPEQIVEAALFVGGGALSAKKLCTLLRGGYDTAFVTTTIDDLNRQYASEARPYEIISGEGGYRLELRAEYEKLRQRVYGSGPREVKLSQDVLEVLSLVAYQQPISQLEVESHGKQNAGNLLRQLLRRDLVAIQRGDGGRNDVRYLTTPRFLQVFGLASLDELPQPDDLARK
jgi:segregation and condensation protein B